MYSTSFSSKSPLFHTCAPYYPVKLTILLFLLMTVPVIMTIQKLNKLKYGKRD